MTFGFPSANQRVIHKRTSSICLALNTGTTSRSEAPHSTSITDSRLATRLAEEPRVGRLREFLLAGHREAQPGDALAPA